MSILSFKDFLFSEYPKFGRKVQESTLGQGQPPSGQTVPGQASNPSIYAKLKGMPDFDWTQNREQIDRFSYAAGRLLGKYKFFGSLYKYLEIIFTQHKKVPTACVDGKRMWVNTKFLSVLTDEQIKFLIAHEICHCAFGHFARRGYRDPKKWNVATDLEINPRLIEENLMTLEELKQMKGLYNVKFHGMAAEEIYKVLYEEKTEPEPQEESVDDVLNESEGDSLDEETNPQTQKKRQQQEQKAKENAEKAKQEQQEGSEDEGDEGEDGEDGDGEGGSGGSSGSSSSGKSGKGKKGQKGQSGSSQGGGQGDGEPGDDNDDFDDALDDYENDYGDGDTGEDEDSDDDYGQSGGGKSNKNKQNKNKNSGGEGEESDDDDEQDYDALGGDGDGEEEDDDEGFDSMGGDEGEGDQSNKASKNKNKNQGNQGQDQGEGEEGDGEGDGEEGDGEGEGEGEGSEGGESGDQTGNSQGDGEGSDSSSSSSSSDGGKSAGGGSGQGTGQGRDAEAGYDGSEAGTKPRSAVSGQIKIGDRRLSSEEWQKIAASAASEMGASKGMREALTKLVKPKVNWKREISKFIASAKAGTEWTLPNKRFIHQGKYRFRERQIENEFERVVVAIDVSGSISDKMVNHFLSEVSALMKTNKIKYVDVVYFHHDVGGVDNLYRAPKFDKSKIPPSGGTSFMPWINWITHRIRRERKNVDMVIAFTDGENFDTVTAPAWQKKAIWIIFDNVTKEIPFGRRIDITLRDL
jgi:predicted metal-dependent peptidase